MKLKIDIREPLDGNVYVNLWDEGASPFAVGAAKPRTRGPNTTKLRALKDARDSLLAMARKLDRMAISEENRVAAAKRSR